MKKFTIKGVLDGIRGSVSQQPKAEVDFIEETLRPEHFQVMKTVRHGFPYQPTAMAFDPVQRILAIGTKSGSLRILGRPGVDCHVTHNSDQAVIQILFLVNEGALVSVCADDRLHLWNLRQKMPDIVHSLAFQKERITYCHLPFQSKWLYIGTERGNIHVVNIESFVLSGYVINWNKAIELSRKTHPGAVVHLSDNPIDNSKLLIGFETGSIVFWDLRTRTAEARFQHTEALRAVAWHHDGKQFMCSHTDGSLTTWNIKSPSKPMSILFPHAKPNKDGKPETCKAISKLEWKSQKGGEMFLIFCGGLPLDRAGRTPSITVIHGKTTTVLEMEHTVVDFITLCESPWQSDFQDPYAIVVLLHNDLVVVDLTSPGYLCFENPYPMDLHESPVTCCMYLADCPSDLVPAFYSVGSRAHKRAGFSEKAWPISGGAWGTNTCSYPDIIITGHADGSLKFWDASAVLLQILYKLKTAKIFEKPKAKSLDSMEEDPFAIQQIAFCPESRLLCIANVSSHVILFRFSRSESMIEVPVLEIPIIYEVDDVVDYSPDYEYPPRPSIGGASHHGSYASSSEENKKPSLETFIPTRVKSGPQKRAPGFQPCIVCQTPWIEGAPPGQITSLSINSSYGLMAYGNESGLVIVDVFQKSCLLNIGSPDLYGSSDPYQRIPRSPKKNQCDTNSGESAMDRCRSPTSDQMNGVCLSPTTGKQGQQAQQPQQQQGPQPPPTQPQQQQLQLQTLQPQQPQQQPLPTAATVAASAKKLYTPDLKRTKSQEKIDNSFSRSRSSSMSSLENITSEAIQCLVFADSYTRKADCSTCPTLWVGTSLGSVLVIILNLPPTGDLRQTQPVIVSPSGTIFRLKGAILTMAFLDCNGALIHYQFENWKDINKLDIKERERERPRTPLRSPHNPTTRVSPTTSSEMGDRQFVVLASEKQACVVALPSQTCAFKVQVADVSFVVKAEVISVRDSVCLACYIANGHLATYSLPSLRPLMDIEFVPLIDLRIARTFCFSNYGHGMYLCSPCEIQKFTICVGFCDNLNEMLGDLFLPCETPEPPKEGFFKNLFGGGPRALDREELFGEASGKASRSVAKHIPGNVNVEHLNSKTVGVAGEVAKAHKSLIERGENLSHLEDRTAQMMSEAEVFSKAAHQIMLKNKDKKWYQF